MISIGIYRAAGSSSLDTLAFLSTNNGNKSEPRNRIVRSNRKTFL